jgi:pilus assembly protein CpaE
MQGDKTMYPLSIVLIGSDDHCLVEVRHELVNNSAVIESEFADVNGAMDGLDKDQVPRMFIVHLQSKDEVDGLHRIISQFPGQPILALVNAENPEELSPREGNVSFTEFAARREGNGSDAKDVKAAGEGDSGKMAPLLLPAMRAGAMQVVTVPVDPSDFRQALDCLAIQFGHPTENKVIAVSGVLGGVGAATIAINLAHEIAHHTGQSCVLAELAVHLGKLATFLNIQPQYTVRDLLTLEHLDLYSVRQALTQVGDNLQILAGPYQDVSAHDGLYSDGAKICSEMLEIVESLRRVAPYVVLDIPCTLDSLYFDALAKANQVVLVADQTLPAIHNLTKIRQTLEREEGIKIDRLLINKYDPNVKGYSAQALSELLKIPNVMTIESDSTTVNGALNRGYPWRVHAPGSKVLHELDHVLEQLNVIGGQHRRSKTSLFGRLFGSNQSRSNLADAVRTAPHR